ncbi:MAG TPA: hypothetical protein VKV39_13190 [Candidatus Sulfotelmatobacter sp.]|nr:hypothetical protein [Candidatus Sulfotelmatobacter sp.]
MYRQTATTFTSGALALLSLVIAAYQVQAQGGAGQAADSPYPSMAPLDQYLMADRSAEIALARTAAPKSISADATVMVLGRHGYETVAKGKSGFVCIVERAWMSPFDHPEFWNPKNRSPICYNPAAARSILPYTLKRTELVLAGLSKPQILERIKTMVGNKALPMPEPGAMSYMMSKEQYLNDAVVHWFPHLMLHVPKTDAASWGANFDGSPVLMDPRELPEPEAIFFVPVGTWSDGTQAPAM